MHDKIAYDPNSWEEFFKIDEQTRLTLAMYDDFASTPKLKGSNYTPPKKKRKKK